MTITMGSQQPYRARGIRLVLLVFALLCLSARVSTLVDAWSTIRPTSAITSRRSLTTSTIARRDIFSSSFSSFSSSSSSSWGRLQTSIHSKKNENDVDDDDHPEEVEEQQQISQKKKQEMLMEQLSLSGAERISAMSIPERTKRAMLAEAVEDRIFELTDVLENLVNQSGEGPLVSEKNREEALEVARQTKALQVQYEELVSGKPSSMLQSMESVMGGGSGEGGEGENKDNASSSNGSDSK